MLASALFTRGTSLLFISSNSVPARVEVQYFNLAGWKIELQSALDKEKADGETLLQKYKKILKKKKKLELALEIIASDSD